MQKPVLREPVSRAPNGMDHARVNMPLTPSEREDLRALANRESRSIGSMARLLYLRGLAAYKAELAGAAPPP